MLRIEVESAAFDPVLRLWTRSRVACGDNDDGGNDLASRFSWLVTSAGKVRAQVASFGDGGGGPYKIQLVDVPVPDLPLGTKQKSSLGEGSTEHWHFEGRAGQTLFLSARSTVVDTALVLFDPAGVEVGRDEDAGGDRNVLPCIRFPRHGRYTLAVSARSGRGEYALLALDPDLGR